MPQAEPLPIAALPALAEVRALLATCELPAADLVDDSPHRFFGIRVGGALVGVVGLERCGGCGLLRSLAIAPNCRERGFARDLVGFLEAYAAAQGLQALYLLTTSAEHYFARLGYRPVERDRVPPPIRATRQFAELCPAAAVAMVKPLVHAEIDRAAPTQLAPAHALTAHSWLRPAAPCGPQSLRHAVLILLLASALLLLFAAAAMPPPYSWLSHSVSESAAQAQAAAWIARLSFLCFGGAVLTLCLMRRTRWSAAAFYAHLVFAASMWGTAAFSHKPWLPEVGFDATEDLLHSITATAMGFAFVAGVFARLAEHWARTRKLRALDLLAVLAGTVLSPLGLAFPEIAGLLQRAMFLVAYLWYGAEALRASEGAAAE